MAPLNKYVNVYPENRDEGGPNEIPAIQCTRGVLVRAKVKGYKPKKGRPRPRVAFEVEAGADNFDPTLFPDAPFVPKAVAKGEQFERTKTKPKRKKGKKRPRGFWATKLHMLKSPGSTETVYRRVNDDGWAELPFYTSEYGGDTFKVRAYLVLKGGEKGTELTAEKEFQVWKRIYVQVTRFGAGPVAEGRKWRGQNVIGPVRAMSFDNVVKEYKKHFIELIFEPDFVSPRYEHVLWDLHGRAKESAAHGFNRERQPINMNLVLAHKVISMEPKTYSFKTTYVGKPFEFPLDKPLVIDETKPEKLDWLEEHRYRVLDGSSSWRDIPLQYIEAKSPKLVVIDLQKLEREMRIHRPVDVSPGLKMNVSFKVPIEIQVKVRTFGGGLGGYTYPTRAPAVWVGEVRYSSNKDFTAGEREHIAIHEIGHNIGMVPSYQATKTPESKHCSHKTGGKTKCVMFPSVHSDGSDFCSYCGNSLLIADARLPRLAKGWG